MKKTLQVTDKKFIWVQKLIGPTLVGLGLGSAGALWTNNHIVGGTVLPNQPLAYWVLGLVMLLAGITLWARSRKYVDTSNIPLHKQPGGQILQSYQTANFVVLRTYGLAFLALGYGYTTGAISSPEIVLGVGMSPPVLTAICGVIGVGLILPILTPDVLGRPATVSAGVSKALILLGLSAPLYWEGMAFLESGTLRFGARYAEIFPMLFKSIAGLSITGAILVSLATQLSQMGKTSEVSKPLMSRTDLKTLRHARMSSVK